MYGLAKNAVLQRGNHAEEKIPRQIIADFEGNIKTVVADCVASRVGQASHTLVTAQNVSSLTHKPVVKEAEGYTCVLHSFDYA